MNYIEDQHLAVSPTAQKGAVVKQCQMKLTRVGGETDSNSGTSSKKKVTAMPNHLRMTPKLDAAGMRKNPPHRGQHIHRKKVTGSLSAGADGENCWHAFSNPVGVRQPNGTGEVPITTVQRSQREGEAAW